MSSLHKLPILSSAQFAEASLTVMCFRKTVTLHVKQCHQHF